MRMIHASSLLGVLKDVKNSVYLLCAKASCQVCPARRKAKIVRPVDGPVDGSLL